MRGYCGVCRTSPASIAAHGATAAHRKATRPRATAGRRTIRPRAAWHLALADDGILAGATPAELAAALRWAEGDTL